ncbi:MAG: hypothetical protein R2781_00375 [Flavobacteriaceae bacterium]
MKHLPLFFLFFTALLSCGKSSSKETLSQDILKDTMRYGAKNFSLPVITPKANEIIENWPIFQEFKAEITSLKELTLEELKNKSERLLVQTDSISKHIPDTLFSNAIFSRVSIVKTRVNLLKQEVNKGTIRPQEIEKNLTETQNAVTNFIIQINEKVLKDKIDFQRKDDEEKELEKQRKAKDSIFKLELNDQKKQLP